MDLDPIAARYDYDRFPAGDIFQYFKAYLKIDVGLCAISMP
jgi:hypothetical protein